MEGTELEIVLDGLSYWRDDRNGALLAAFAGDGELIALADRRIDALESQRFGNAQARAVKQGNDSRIARQHPLRPVFAGTRILIEQRAGSGCGKRFRQAARLFRAA